LDSDIDMPLAAAEDTPRADIRHIPHQAPKVLAIEDLLNPIDNEPYDFPATTGYNSDDSSDPESGILSNASIPL
jgi:hypothetical protein